MSALAAMVIEDALAESESMVERVKLAIFNRANEMAFEPARGLADWYNELSLAAIAIMREPTDAMLDATCSIRVDCYSDPSAGVHPDQWRAMIDAAME